MSKPPQNKFITRLRRLLDRKKSKDDYALFYKARKDFFDHIWNNKDKIIETKTIDVEKSSTTEQAKILLENNKGSFVNESYILNQEITDQIVELLEAAEKAPKEQTILTTESRTEFKDVFTEFDDEFDSEETENLDKSKDTIYLKPKESFTYSSFAMNFLYSRDITYIYNPNIPQHLLEENSNFFTAKFEIISFLDTVDFPTRFTVTCTHKNRYGEECGNIVYFSHVHRHSTIRCTDSVDNPEGMDAHTIKNTGDAEVRGGDMIKLYAYTVRDVHQSDEESSKQNSDESGLQEFILYSTTRLNEYEVEGNIIDAKKGGDRLRILIAKKESPPRTLDEPILLKDKKNYSFLTDIYESVKNYLGEHHNIKMTNQNKIVGEFIIFQVLCNLYYDFAYKSLVVGTSGAGKSWIAKYVTKLFTNAQVIVNGNDVTRNRLLGGRANYQSDLFNSPYSPGYMATHDLVVLEEMTNQIALFNDTAAHNATQNVSNNVMSMLKGVDEKFQEYDVGIQGSIKSRVRASTVMFGNLEQLSKIRNNYTKHVRKKYKELNTGVEQNFSSRWPIYKPIEFYSDYMNNVALAKAHQHVRKNLLPRNFVTQLPQAEQNRILVMITLEDFETGYSEVETNMVERFSSYIHREELQEELSQAFSTPMTDELYESVQDFMNKEYFRERNNIVIDRSINYNIHIRVKMMKLCALLVHMNKLYWTDSKGGGHCHDEQSLKTLNDDDKNFIRYYMRFNYNTLSIEEARGIKKPYMNDLIFDTDEITDEIDTAIEMKEKQKELEKEARKGIDIGDVFDTESTR